MEFKAKPIIYNHSVYCPKIEKVIFNPPATIIIFKDGSKSVVKCTDNDTWDPEKGFYAAFLKRILGKTTLHSLYKKFVKPEEELEAVNMVTISDAIDALSNLFDKFKAPTKTWEESAKAEKDE